MCHNEDYKKLMEKRKVSWFVTMPPIFLELISVLSFQRQQKILKGWFERVLFVSFCIKIGTRSL